MKQNTKNNNFADVDINQKAWQYVKESVSAFPDWENRIALSDGKRKYTYAQFFYHIEKYASVFSALSMTEKDKARVGLLGVGASVTIISLYALNMTGAEISLISSLSALKAEKIMQVVKDEHLTDLILTDDLIQDNTFRKILDKKDELGLRFVLLLHVPVCGPTVPTPFAVAFEQKANYTRCFYGALYMDYLVELYGSAPIKYAEAKSCDTAVIMHTSGTTGGSGSPIVMSDVALNAMSRSIIKTEGYEELKKDPSIAMLVDLSNAYGLLVQVHMPLCLCGKIAIIPGNSLNPFFFRIIPVEKTSVFFCTGAVIEMWMKMSGIAKFDFSSLQCVILGGTSVSAEDKKRYLEFLQKNGMGEVPLLNGYGISELGGVCTLSTPDIEDESIGQLIYGMEAKFFDEDTNTYKSLSDAPCTGVLYLHSKTMCTPYLDGEELVKTEDIDGKPYICTNDLVEVDESGKLIYLGRANRYFLHSDGKKYQSGRVETEISKRRGIKSCGIVPVFDKPHHDNLPMLCVSTSDKAGNEIETVRQALLDTFGKGQALSADNLPYLVLIAKELPRNANGKIDLYKLNRGEVEGIKYEVTPVKNGNYIIDITLVPQKNDLKDIVTETYKDIAKDIMDESITGRIAGDIKQIGSAIKPAFHLNSYQYMQMMAWIYQAWQYYNYYCKKDK